MITKSLMVENIFQSYTTRFKRWLKKRKQTKIAKLTARVKALEKMAEIDRNEIAQWRNRHQALRNVITDTVNTEIWNMDTGLRKAVRDDVAGLTSNKNYKPKR